MKSMTLVLTGAGRYWAHPALVKAVLARTEWDDRQAKSFLMSNETVRFHGMSRGEVLGLLGELEGAGFDIAVQDGKGEIRAALSLSSFKEIDDLRAVLSDVQERLHALETDAAEKKETPPAAYAPQIDAIFDSAPESSERISKTSQKKSRAHTEMDIGRYWLSRAGVFTFLVGIVFLLTYTAQYAGVWGKLAIGAASGALLSAAGNFAARKDAYRRWAMALIGGGWAISFFTVFAAYHVPAVKVIENPVAGLLFLAVISAGSLAQALSCRSPALVFMTYFLAYFSLAAVDISWYSLAASVFLGISIVFLSRRLKWDWLGFTGLVLVYGTHWIWIEPSIYFGSSAGGGTENLGEMLYLPWTGDEWRIYPVIPRAKSYLHLAFLSVYFSMFSFAALLGRERAESGKENRAPVLLSALNNLFFVTSFMHHLHVYFPQFKPLFAAFMAALFLGFSALTKKRDSRLLSDIYLGYGVSIASLIFPLYWDGEPVTHGWCAAAFFLAWLGSKRGRPVLFRTGCAFAVLVLVRLVYFDVNRTREYDFLFLSFNAYLPLAIAAAASFSGIHRIAKDTNTAGAREKDIISAASAIAVPFILCAGALFGGWREAASFAGLAAGSGLLAAGVLQKSRPFRIAAAVLLFLALFRFLAVDFTREMLRVFDDAVLALRYSAGAFVIPFLLYFSEWLRRAGRPRYFRTFAVSAALLYLALTADRGLDSITTLYWGIGAFSFIVFGFRREEKFYRWTGLCLFVLVLARLFFYDFAKLEMIYRIFTFIGLGAVLLIASLAYSRHTKSGAPAGG